MSRRRRLRGGWGCPTPSKRFVQFRRDIGPTGATLTCHFPDAPWSAAYVPRLKQVLEANNISYSELSIRSDDPVTGFVSIEDLDVPAAIHLVDVVFIDVFKCSSVNVRLWGHGVRGDVSSDVGRDPIGE